MSSIAELTIFPLDKGTSLSTYVAKAVKIIKSSGLNYDIGSMGTSFEGEWDEVFEVVKKCMEALKNDSTRVYMILKIDYSSDKNNRMKNKINSVKNKL